MSTTFYTAQEAAKVLATIARGDLNLSSTVARDVESDFNPSRGLVVPVRIPGATVAGTKSPSDVTTPLTVGSIVEQTVPVTIDVHAYNRQVLSEADLSLNLQDYASQVLRAQAAALAEYAEARVTTVFKATPLTELTYDAANPARLFTQARGRLRENGVSASTPLLAAVGSNVYGALLDGPVTTFDANGRVRGFSVLESTRLDADEVVFYIRNAATLVVRAPIAPEGAPFSASVKVDTDDGSFAARLIRAYNPNVAAEESLVSVLLGARAMPLSVVDAATGEVDLVEHGGMIRVDTSA